MTQLIIDDVALPESQKGGYNIQSIPLFVDVEMASGKLVRELRGNVWNITYKYPLFDAELKDAVIAACERGKRQAIYCGFLPQKSSGELSYSYFFVTEFARPHFMWSRDGTPLWADFSLALREVRPHD